jgi:hypothetical protein
MPSRPRTGNPVRSGHRIERAGSAGPATSVSPARVNRKRRGRWVLVICLGLLALAGLCFLWAYPTVVLGVDSDALTRSVLDEAGGTSLIGRPRCEEKHTGLWLCKAPVAQWSGARSTYRVTTDGLGCWDSKRAGPPGKGTAPKHLSGCIDMLDVLRG